MISLSIEKRDAAAKLSDIRKAGKVPAVYYGPKEASTSISVNAIEFKKVLKKAGESSVVVLTGAGEEHESLIHDLDIHPLTGEVRHADFYVFEKGKKLEVAVQLNFTGIAPAVKDKGGILVKVHREVTIEAAPKDLPHELEVDISKLVELTDTISAKDIKLPAGVELKINPEEVIASISEAKEEVEEVPVAPDLSAIEVEAKGKEAKEGEDGAEAAAPEKK
jgi:large subunit ribosomal protein L25